jgi:beta-phosphoglucomutase-like phosphatase (HAD superfamily)
MTKPVLAKSLIMLLDIDGTLVDTDAHLSNTISRLFKKYGVDFAPAEFFQPQTFMMQGEDGSMQEKTSMLFGAGWEDTYYCLKARNPDITVDVASFRKEIIEAVTASRDGVVPRQDVIDMILALRDECAQQGMGFTAIAVTNGALKEAKANLEIAQQAGLTVDGLISADDVQHRKPHPQPYYMGYTMACRNLVAQGKNPAHAIVIKLEDSPPGAISAATAAMTYKGMCYYIPTRNRPILMPKLDEAQQEHFVVEQDIAALGLQLSTVIKGRSDPHARAGNHHALRLVQK